MPFARAVLECVETVAGQCFRPGVLFTCDVRDHELDTVPCCPSGCQFQKGAQGSVVLRSLSRPASLGMLSEADGRVKAQCFAVKLDLEPLTGPVLAFCLTLTGTLSIAQQSGSQKNSS